MSASASPSRHLVREVNEQIRFFAERWGRRGELEVLCECEDGCFEHVRMTIDEYAAVRRSPDRFFVRPEHSRPAGEHVVEATPRYLVVERQKEVRA